MDADYQQWFEDLQARVAGPRGPTLEPAPCDGCPRARRCAAELLACSAFARFHAGLRWEIAPRIDATRERYERIFGKRPGV